jgi:hypothetical protein
MSTPQWRLTGGPGAVHPVVLSRRLSDLGTVAIVGLIPALIGLAVSIGLPGVSLFLVLAAIAAILAVVALMMCSRLDLTVALLVLYLGLLDGPAKLLFGGHEIGAGVRNVLILAVCVGVLMRMAVRRQRLRMPALSGWVLAFVGVAMIEVFNPKTEGILKVAGGFRQQLQFVPFFFFGYYLMRSKRNFRRLFVIVGVLALANGVVAAYQTELTPAQLAAWGPGYHNLIYISSEAHGTGRTYVSEGEARVRPMGLGADQGFGGGMGAVALSFCLALLATARRRKWRVIAALLCLGAIVAIITGLNRAPVIGAGLAVCAFAGFSALAGRRVTRTLVSLAAVVVLAVPVGVLVVATLRSGTFKRYERIGSSSSTTEYKQGAWSLIPHYLSVAPFGFGLGSVGSVSGLEGKNKQLLEGHGVSSETQFNLIVNELGAPGLVVWTAMVIYILIVITRGMPTVRDGDMAIMLAGALAPLVAVISESTSGAITNSAVWGTYFWFAIGVAAYWFAGRRRELARSASELEGSEPELARSSAGGPSAQPALA